MIYFTTIFGISKELFFPPIVEMEWNMEINELAFALVGALILVTWLVIDEE